MIPHLQNNGRHSLQCVEVYMVYIALYEHREKYGKTYSTLKALRWGENGARADHKKKMEKDDYIKINFFKSLHMLHGDICVEICTCGYATF